ncbi:hypothetical protein RRG08_025196 [Elysia crispata]|uniref:15-hydroxyprostaglandin dehydrogenase [NAD(+)] n=1 Tax=Elysia crispata TaxID=231223 RepID=A0AAE1AAL0_9GAST|nr:hypothetical protein RRG08_025196 [Elysia crispata]
MTAYDLAGKVFFITGGAGDIGRSITEGVLDKKSKVFFIDNNEEAGRKVLDELLSKYGGNNVDFFACDVTDRDNFEEAFQQAVDKFGHVDIMFNNAGIMCEAKPKRVVEINLLGSIYGSEIAAAHMTKDKGGKGGRIINMSSVAGIQDITAVPTYGATKQGIRSFTISCSMQPNIEDVGIEYAVLHPGNVSTGLNSNLEPGDLLFMDKLVAIKNNLEITTMTLERVVEAFLKLVTLEKMNGAMLEVTRDKICFVRLERQELGSIYPPP